MHAFQKWKRQLHVGEIIMGSATLHRQPKEHVVAQVTATVAEINDGSVKLSLKYTKDLDRFLPELTLRKANVMEYGPDFRILYEEKRVLYVFVVAKTYVV